ncbi:2Fe-2S iron-sulfur cluster-binding protein [Sphingomonas sp.]|uniref:2Fe-2S iron-sulfur cluster-binding protein n=1 Tax=Sphingomonas sp. TaxID=28214 RepID=UPI003AFF7566
MPSIRFEMPDGATRDVVAPIGESVMRAAVQADVPGVVAECRGVLTCATCHVYVLGDWADKFPPPELDESDLLEIVDDPRPNSRLSCQLVVDETTDGVAIGIPAIAS